MEEEIRDIVLSVELELPTIANQPQQKELLLYNEGVYWFLYPLFQELRTNHGKDIDLYDDVSFSGVELDLLLSLIDKAKSITAAQPPSWSQKIATRISILPWKRAVKVKVIRVDLETWLSNLEFLIKRACKNNGVISFLGN